MKGKEKCKALKEIRRQIAEENDIPFAVSQCTYQGDCKGTCPKCESELQYLERELAIRQGLGKAVAVVGISTALGTSLSACQTPQLAQKGVSPQEPPVVEELEGDVAMEREIVTPSSDTDPKSEGGLSEWNEPDTDGTELVGEIAIDDIDDIDIDDIDIDDIDIDDVDTEDPLAVLEGIALPMEDKTPNLPILEGLVPNKRDFP